MVAMFRGLDEDKYDRSYTDAQLIRRIASYFGQYRRQFIIVVTGFAAISLVQSLQPILIAQAVDQLSLNDPIYLVLSGTPIARDLADFALLRGVSLPDSVVLIMVALLASAFFYYVVNWVRRYFAAVVIGNVVANLRKDAFAAAVDRDLAFYDKNKSGKIVSRITTDTQEFGEVTLIATDVIAQLISVIVLFIALLTASVPLTLLLILTMPMIVGAALGFRRMARFVTRQGSRAMANVNDNIQESVTGISVAKNFRREAMMYSEFDRINRDSYRINLLRGGVLALVFPVLNILAGFAIALILYAGAGAVVGGVIGVGAWFLFIQGVDRFWFPFINLAAFWSQFQQALSSTERIFALIDTENTIVQHDTQPAGTLAGHITFDRVDFGYEDGTRVLTGFNLDIKPGENVAFVGHTGAGKSTIAKLITRFYEFQSGQIRVDGQDIRAFDLQSYRGRLGIVPQQPFLFSGTIIDNIRYSRPDASDEEIAEIANSIGKGEWLETLPDGLYSDVGERGARLSMGQRQLVSLVRVLLQKPSIFILDEATASIDPFTETQIQEALDMILAQATSILIAHRLSTVRSADRIIVLRQGAIIEQGSHEQLMQQGGHYAELYDTYFRHQSLSYIENARTELLKSAGD